LTISKFFNILDQRQLYQPLIERKKYMEQSEIAKQAMTIAKELLDDKFAAEMQAILDEFSAGGSDVQQIAREGIDFVERASQKLSEHIVNVVQLGKQIIARFFKETARDLLDAKTDAIVAEGTRRLDAIVNR